MAACRTPEAKPFSYAVYCGRVSKNNLFILYRLSNVYEMQRNKRLKIKCINACNRLLKNQHALTEKEFLLFLFEQRLDNNRQLKSLSVLR